MAKFKQDSIEFNLLLNCVFAFLGINRDEDVNFFRVTNVGASLGNCCYGIVLGGLANQGNIFHYQFSMEQQIRTLGSILTRLKSSIQCPWTGKSLTV